jgi:hypothetical protein
VKLRQDEEVRLGPTQDANPDTLFCHRLRRMTSSNAQRPRSRRVRMSQRGEQIADHGVLSWRVVARSGGKKLPYFSRSLRLCRN